MSASLPISLRLYRLLSRALTPLVPLMLERRQRQGREDPFRLAERRGDASVERPAGPLVWIHAASVGELAAVSELIARIAAQELHVLVTTGTVSSANFAKERLPAGVMHQFVPVDVSRFVARFFDHWQPDLAIFVESEIWPNLTLACEAARIPMLVVNGRLSERAFLRWRVLPRAAESLLRQFDLCLARSALDAERFANLGARRVQVTGNLKLDVPAPPVDPDAAGELRVAINRRPVVTGASTHGGEESALIDAHRRLRHAFPDLLTIVAPRHVHRGRGIFDAAERAGIPVALRSLGQLPERHTQIYVADTMGELGTIFSLSPIVFMGGSLVEHGGQNPIEAIKLGAAVLHGPLVWNFAEIYAALDAAHGAQEVTDAEHLVSRLGALLKDHEAREAMARAGFKTVTRLGGALERTLAAIEPYLLQLRLKSTADA